MILVHAVLAAVLAFGQPRMDDGTNVRVPDKQSETESAARDRRPFYVGGGVIVLVALLLWNRRHRAALERESEAETRRIRERARAKRASQQPVADVASAADDDPDAADLRAAARSSDQEQP